MLTEAQQGPMRLVAVSGEPYAEHRDRGRTQTLHRHRVPSMHPGVGSVISLQPPRTKTEPVAAMTTGNGPCAVIAQLSERAAKPAAAAVEGAWSCPSTPVKGDDAGNRA